VLRKSICAHCKQAVPPEKPTQRFNAEIETALYNRFKRVAIKRKLTLSNAFRQMLEDFVASDGSPKHEEAHA
jgi:macrodomain Ter protein organizer (MatP/YcbG family)